MVKYVGGIDFGTTNSAASIADKNTTRMISIDGTHETIPTALYFPDASSNIFIGHAARDAYTSGDTNGRLMRSLKRILGTDAMSGGTVINGHHQSFETIIGYFIRYIKSQIDAIAGIPVDSVVMGRPVHFRDNDPAADVRAENELRRIAQSVGFKNIEFQFEPIAAAFAHEQHLTSEKLAVVIDVGGGTSDFTIIRLGPGRINHTNRTDDVLANTGVRIGGNDFDRDFALASVMPLFGMGGQYRSGEKLISIPPGPYISLSTWSAINEVYNLHTLNMARTFRAFGTAPEKTNRLYEIIYNRYGHANLEMVELAKIALSSNNTTRISLDFLTDVPVLDIMRSGFEASIAATTDAVIRCATKCVGMANVAPSDIDMVILTGGTTEIPYIANKIHQLFPSADVSSSNKMASVAMGLGMDARRRFL